MRNLIYSINLTIDGCVDHTKVRGSEEILEYFRQLLRTADLLLYGRVTYELMVPYWPNIAKNPSGHQKAEIEYAEAFNSIDKVVFSQSLERVEDNRSRLVRTKPEDEILKLKQRPGKDILIGGVALPSYLIKLGLIDEFLFVVHPFIAGEGRRMLEGIIFDKSLPLKLVDSQILQSGCAALRYRPAAN